MNEIIVAFITGLTTGGLSCLAVQGGLLASSLAHQIERDMLTAPAAPAKKGKRVVSAARINTALPILLFLAAKLVVYTLLGALLGWLGAFLTFDPITRALLLIAIGVFMLGNALRMFNVHPIFRYFNFEPPKFITRYIRRTSKGTETATPLLLGALTVFIPCGVTQAMMAAALGTGSAITGALLMAAFTLGASPVFFLVAYLATEIGARFERYFTRFVAVVLLILGWVSIDNGLNLMGAPFSFANLTRGLVAVAEAPSVAPSAPASANLTLDVRDNGYSPATLRAVADQPVRLTLVTNQTYSCARDFVIPALKYYALLPDTGREIVEIPPQKAGTVIPFTCSMGMYTGQIIFE